MKDLIGAILLGTFMVVFIFGSAWYISGTGFEPAPRRKKKKGGE